MQSEGKVKELNLEKIGKEDYCCRNGKKAKFLNYVKGANPKNKLLFLLEGNILGCDEKGICWTINSYDAAFTDTSYRQYDIFVNDIVNKYLILYGDEKVDEKLFDTYDEAKQYSKECYKIIKIQWSEE